MGQKVMNALMITGFTDEEERRRFAAAAAKGSIPFSLERLLPLPPPEDIERELEDLFRERFPRQKDRKAATLSDIAFALTWGSWIYEKEGDSESINNRVKEVSLGGEPGLIYYFESRNDPPIPAIRHLSHRHPHLLFKLGSEDDAPCFGFALFRGGQRFQFFMDQEEYEITEAGKWPILAALHLQNHEDAKLHLFVKEAAEKLPADLHFQEELQAARQEERQKIKEEIARFSST